MESVQANDGEENGSARHWTYYKLSVECLLELHNYINNTCSGHEGPVLCVEWGQTECFSGGLDGTIYAWPIPKVSLSYYYNCDNIVRSKRNYMILGQNPFLVDSLLDIVMRFGPFKFLKILFSQSPQMNQLSYGTFPQEK